VSNATARDRRDVIQIIAGVAKPARRAAAGGAEDVDMNWKEREVVGARRTRCVSRPRDVTRTV